MAYGQLGGGHGIFGGGGSSTQASLHIDDILTALGIASEAATMPNGTGSVWPDGSTQAAINQALETAVEGKADTSSLTPDAATAAGPLCKDEAGQVVNCGNLEDVAYPQTDNDTLGDLSCSAGQIPKLVEGVWACADDAGGTVATSLIEEAANLQAADFNGLKPFAWTGGNLTLPTAAAHLYRPFGIGFPSGTYGLVPASYLDVISYNGTAITAGYSLACSGVGLYSIMGTGANAWQVFGPASGCTKGTTTHLADLNLSVSSLVFGGEETKSVTVTNAGTRPTTPATSLTTGTHFTISADTCDGESIAPAGTCYVSILSDGTGTYEDTLNIAYNDYPDHAASESPLEVSLSEEAAVSGCPDAAYLLCEMYSGANDCDGTNSYGNNTWTNAGSGTVNCGATAIDDADYAMTVDSSINSIYAYAEFTSAGTVYGMSTIKTNSTFQSASAAFVGWYNSTNHRASIALVGTSDDGNTGKIYVVNGSETSTQSVSAMSTGTTYRLWSYYTKATSGSNGVSWACFTDTSTNSAPSVNSDCSSLPDNCTCLSNGSSNTNLDRLYFGFLSSASNRIITVGKTRVKSTAITLP